MDKQRRDTIGQRLELDRPVQQVRTGHRLDVDHWTIVIATGHERKISTDDHLWADDTPESGPVVLARFGDPEATAVLTDALKRLDPSFVRAETALRVDLATALAATGDRDEARTHAHRADRLAAQVGSARQRRRIKTILATVR
jgi:hypothetical protein